MSVIINGNNQTVYGDFTSITQSYTAVTNAAPVLENPIYSYAPNSISITGNNDTVYGNGGDVSFSATGASNNTISGTGISEIQLLTFTMGGNSLFASGNNNTIYGSIRDMSFTLTGGDNNTSPGASGFADLDSYNVLLGNNIIGTASSPISGNNDVIYGAMRNFTMDLIGGYDPATDNRLNGGAYTDQFNVASMPHIFSMGANNITVGNGNNDVIFGAMQDISISATSPDGSNTLVTQHRPLVTPYFSYNIGGNTIVVGSGNNDTVFGALQDFNLLLASGTGNNIGNVSDRFIDYNLGMNNITVSSGNNDTVYGAMQDLSINVDGPGDTMTIGFGSPAQPYLEDNWNIGANTVQVGNGNNDVVYGAMQDLAISSFGSDNNTQILPSSEGFAGSTYIVGQVISVGSNIISVGNGNNDVVYGALQDFTLDYTGGSGNIGDAGYTLDVSDTYRFVNNMITVGNGNNDTVYGAMEDFSITCTGGNNNTISTTEVYAGGGSTEVASDSFSAGGNHIIVGNGNNDIVYGDMDSLNISLFGGSSNTGGENMGSAVYFQNTISLGGDTIQVGNGNNDVVFASMNSLTLLAQNGINNDPNSGFASFSQPNIPGVTPAGDSVISFNDTTVTIGNGKNDTVVADDALNLSGLNYFLDAPTPPGQENQIQWGNNTIIGGTGNDNYVFSMVVDPNGNMAMQGVDILTDFNPAKKDMLSFGYVTGAANAATLDANSAFVDIHVGGTLSGAIDGVAAIFNQGLGSSVATALETAINSYIATNVPAATGLALLQDVAGYIANGLASAAGVTAADVQGGLILEGQTSATLGSFTAISSHHALAVEATAVAVHA